MTAPGDHIPVLMEAVLRTLDPRPGDTVLDCTAGLGGHAAAMAERIGPTGTLVLLDVDKGNLQRAEARVLALPSPPKVLAVHSPFSAAARLAQEQALVVDVLLADLGFSSNQISDGARGFSFQRDGPLDMRLDPTAPVTAAELVNTLPERELAQIIFDYGEDPAARRIAGAIVRARTVTPFSTTAQLAAAVHSVAGRGGRQGGRSPIDTATKTFQALRIAVNDELGHLDALLSSIRRAAEISGTTWLRNEPGRGARIGIIAFHSLEDRPVKNVFGTLVSTGRAEAVERGAVQADEAELTRNSRARSAKLRVIRLGHRD